MAHYELRTNDSDKSIGLWVSCRKPGQKSDELVLAHTYDVAEQYPLAAERYATNRPNLFVDILDVLDSRAEVAQSKNQAVLQNSANETLHALEQSASLTVSLKNLAMRAARVAADGSGNARRFKDARNLWKVLEAHVEAVLSVSLSEPIVDVHKTHNWKKNQPFKNVTVNPGAWFVVSVYSRSNVRKEAIIACRSLQAVWDMIAARNTDKAQVHTALETQKLAVAMNLDYPTYGEVAQLLADANMLVFPSDAALAQWIRDNAGSSDELSRETKVEVYAVGTQGIDEDDSAYIPAYSQLTIMQLAKMCDRFAA